MTTAVSTPRILYHEAEGDHFDMTTLPDPRSRTISPANEDELSTLSHKLINAYQHQTNLDDTLSATRHELETSRERIRQLELENEEHSNMLACGALIDKSTVDAEKNRLLASLVEERRQREEVEKAKKEIEQELENLTTALFEEANKVLSTPRFYQTF